MLWMCTTSRKIKPAIFIWKDSSNTTWRQEAPWSTCTCAVKEHFIKKWGLLCLNLQGLTLGESRHNTDRRLWLHLPGSPLQASYALNTHDKPGGRICDNDAVCWAKSRGESKRQITIIVFYFLFILYLTREVSFIEISSQDGSRKK